MVYIAKRNSENLDLRFFLLPLKINKRAFRLSITTIRSLFLTFLILLTEEAAFPQTDLNQQEPDTDAALLRYDSAKDSLFNYIKKFGDVDRRKNILTYIEDTTATKQDQIIKRVQRLTLGAGSYLENGLDTAGLTAELIKIKQWYDIARDGVFTNTGNMQTNRNLEISYKIIRELLTRTVAKKASLDEYSDSLIHLRNTIDSLYKEDILYRFSSDSAVLMRYVERLTVVLQEVKPINISLKKTIASVSELQTTVNILINKLSSALDQIQVFQQGLSAKKFDREANNLDGPVNYTRSFYDIISFSMMKGWLSFIFYVRNETGRITFLLSLMVVCTIFLVNLRKSVKKQNLFSGNAQEQAVLKYPFLSALVIALNVFQFIFIDPPFFFTSMMWVISGMSLTFMLRNVITKQGMFAWLILFFLFLLACFDNMILQASRPERWMMFALSVAGIVAGSAIVIKGRRNEIGKKIFIYFIVFTVILLVVSLLSNWYGRYNFSKTCLTASFFNITLAILFFWTLQFINQCLALASRVYNRAEKRLFNTSFEHAEGKVPSLFHLLFFAGWFILFARNFYIYKLITYPIKNFIVQKRSIGDFSFSIGNVLEFFLILYISAMISSGVSFFASGKPDEYRGGRKGGLGNWLPLIRIAIISVGVLIAFAAVGIPMDRLTIMLGALSVGIGFGLQNLVNNLVSGLIISFEKPVYVGDIIEIDGQRGVVQSIGFRSSIILTPDGANIVIPNGHLLNQRLVNWTRNNTFKSVDVVVGVAYGTNLEKAINILEKLPAEDERILPSPKPCVIVKQFNTNSIDIQLSFWVRNINDAAVLKSEIFLAIDRAFNENAIKIPFQQEWRIVKDEIPMKNEGEKNSEL